MSLSVLPFMVSAWNAQIFTSQPGGVELGSNYTATATNTSTLVGGQIATISTHRPPTAQADIEQAIEVSRERSGLFDPNTPEGVYLNKLADKYRHSMSVTDILNKAYAIKGMSPFMISAQHLIGYNEWMALAPAAASAAEVKYHADMYADVAQSATFVTVGAGALAVAFSYGGMTMVVTDLWNSAVTFGAGPAVHKVVGVLGGSTTSLAVSGSPLASNLRVLAGTGLASKSSEWVAQTTIDILNPVVMSTSVMEQRLFAKDPEALFELGRATALATMSTEFVKMDDARVFTKIGSPLRPSDEMMAIATQQYSVVYSMKYEDYLKYMKEITASGQLEGSPKIASMFMQLQAQKTVDELGAQLSINPHAEYERFLAAKEKEANYIASGFTHAIHGFQFATNTVVRDGKNYIRARVAIGLAFAEALDGFHKACAANKDKGTTEFARIIAKYIVEAGCKLFRDLIEAVREAPSFMAMWDVVCMVTTSTTTMISVAVCAGMYLVKLAKRVLYGARTDEDESTQVDHIDAHEQNDQLPSIEHKNVILKHKLAEARLQAKHATDKLTSERKIADLELENLKQQHQIDRLKAEQIRELAINARIQSLYQTDKPDEAKREFANYAMRELVPAFSTATASGRRSQLDDHMQKIKAQPPPTPMTPLFINTPYTAPTMDNQSAAYLFNVMKNAPGKQTTTKPRISDPHIQAILNKYGLRGCSSDIVILEEAAFISPDTFYEVIVPLLGVKNTALLAISTPGANRGNYFTALQGLVDQYGKQLFYVIIIGLICEACRKSGAACKHKIGETPEWLPPDRQAKLDVLMSSNPEMRDRELYGVSKDSTRTALRAEQVQRFKERAAAVFAQGKPDVLFTGIDPSGGGQTSDYAMVTMALINHEPVVIGIDRCATSDQEVINRMIDRHFKSIRSKPQFKNSHIRVFVEANNNWLQADHVRRFLSSPRYGSLTCPPFDPRGGQHDPRAGIWTSHDSKFAWIYEMQRSIESMRVADESARVSVTGWDANCNELYDQMKRFRIETFVPKDGDANMQLFYKQVATGKGAGQKDDLFSAMGICLLYMYKSAQDQRFLEWCARTGRAL